LRYGLVARPVVAAAGLDQLPTRLNSNQMAIGLGSVVVANFTFLAAICLRDQARGADNFPLRIAPLEVRLQRLSDIRYKLRELLERWNNWLVLKWLSFSEAYLNERVAVASVVKIGSAPRSEGSTFWEHKQGTLFSSSMHNTDTFATETGVTKRVCLSGDGGFMMNSQEMETAVRLGLDLVVLILEDWAYGMIRWKQAVDGSPDWALTFGNPDFVKYAQAYGAIGRRVEKTEALAPTLEAAFNEGGVQLVVFPVDYAENTRVLVDELRGHVPEIA
jgi:Thiamine pyrophosphate enzyme, C-terminal TPP binding domain